MSACPSKLGRLWLAIAALVGAWDAAAQAPRPLAPSEAQARAIGTGHRLFDANCARCHGTDAKGTADAPNLLRRVRGMSQDRFVEAVLRRYTWSVPSSEAGSEAAVRDAMTRGLLERNPEGSAMPAWEGVSIVRSGVDDLFKYLAAQATKDMR